jgi:hypothetical protein
MSFFKVGYGPEDELSYFETCCSIRQTLSSNKDMIVLRLIFISLFLIIDTQRNVTCTG